MLHVIISPAKQMRIARDSFSPRGIPPFPAPAPAGHGAREAAVGLLFKRRLGAERAHGADGLKGLWRVNDKLLAQNVERLHAFVPVRDAAQLEEPGIARTVSPAAFSYIGIQYQSLAPEVLDLDALAWLEEHLWILSGFYGCVRPFDAVEPYRLEMGAKLAVNGARDLYAFWGDRIARAIEGAVAERAGTAPEPAVIVNLASVEYAKAVLPHAAPTTQVITCIFGEELRGGKPMQRATASKIARGSMVRWMAEQRIEHARDLVRFDVGYRHAPEFDRERRLKTGATERTLTFIRDDSAA